DRAGGIEHHDASPAAAVATSGAAVSAITPSPGQTLGQHRLARAGDGATAAGEGDRGVHLGQAVRSATGHRDLAQDAVPVEVTTEVEDGIDAGQELAVGGVTTQPGTEGERLDPRRYVARGVRMDGAAATLVTGVEGGQQLHDLGPTDLPHHQPVGTH